MNICIIFATFCQVCDYDNRCSGTVKTEIPAKTGETAEWRITGENLSFVPKRLAQTSDAAVIVDLTRSQTIFFHANVAE